MPLSKTNRLMSINECENVVRRLYPNLTVYSAFKFRNFFVFSVNNEDASLYFDFIAVDRKTGETVAITPMGVDDPDEFFKAIEETSVDFET